MMNNMNSNDRAVKHKYVGNDDVIIDDIGLLFEKLTEDDTMSGMYESASESRGYDRDCPDFE